MQLLTVLGSVMISGTLLVASPSATTQAPTPVSGSLIGQASVQTQTILLAQSAPTPDQDKDKDKNCPTKPCGPKPK